MTDANHFATEIACKHHYARTEQSTGAGDDNHCFASGARALAVTIFNSDPATSINLHAALSAWK
jgi:hypothetical protein